MHEVWTMRGKRPTTPTPPTTPVDHANPSYPFQLPGRRSTLRALIDEFRRSEQQHRSDGGCGGGASSWVASSAAAMPPGQLLKAPRSSQRLWRETTANVMKKSASVWYATPPAPDRPLVTRMSMPDLQGFRFPERQPLVINKIAAAVDRIPEEHNWYTGTTTSEVWFWWTTARRSRYPGDSSLRAVYM